MYRIIVFLFLGWFTFLSCEKKVKEKQLYLGGDLSYVNEMEDCGGVYRENGEIVDPYEFFGNKGANISRLRLWHNPDWTNYSSYDDVAKAIKKSKDAGMDILLDFHYSDNWADPGKQIIPEAWKNIEDLETLGDSVYNYTYQTLWDLSKAGLAPEFVQVGNETNTEILMKQHASEGSEAMNWERNIFLLNKGIEAVNDVSEKTGNNIQTMLHIAQPENAFWWFEAAFQNNINDFDWIGLSYYPKWSTYKLNEVAGAIDSLISLYDKRLMVVETAHPYALQNFDEANNILGEEVLTTEYPASPEGQLSFMTDLTKEVVKGGGEGVIYWEPAWISTQCSTRWGKGSHWENATFFDAAKDNEALPAFDFLKYKY